MQISVSSLESGDKILDLNGVEYEILATRELDHSIILSVRQWLGNEYYYSIQVKPLNLMIELVSEALITLDD